MLEGDLMLEIGEFMIDRSLLCTANAGMFRSGSHDRMKWQVRRTFMNIVIPPSKLYKRERAREYTR